MTADSMTFVGFTSTYVLFAGRALRNHRRTRGVAGPQTVMVRGAVDDGAVALAGDDIAAESTEKMSACSPPGAGFDGERLGVAGARSASASTASSAGGRRTPGPFTAASAAAGGVPRSFTASSTSIAIMLARGPSALAKRCAAEGANVTCARTFAVSARISSTMRREYPRRGVPLVVQPRLSVALGQCSRHRATNCSPGMGGRPPGPRMTSAFSHRGIVRVDACAPTYDAS
mmetsp:Transcript_15783/g.66525  ORF Transcript_15783/g.66525 Transcript_15783/m.66525 type:complete len:231 (-) Transcript_15783:698-1390(-)